VSVLVDFKTLPEAPLNDTIIPGAIATGGISTFTFAIHAYFSNTSTYTKVWSIDSIIRHSIF
jgi:hypothetical protein